MGGRLLEGLTMVGGTSDWNEELGCFLKPFLDRLGHKARRRMCPLYVAGLIGPGDRKSVQPMAERLAPGDYDQLHHFVSAGVWNAAPLEPEVVIQADRLVGGSEAVLADAGYGPSAPFRQGLTARKLAWAVGIPRHLKVYPVGVRLIWPVTKVRGRPRKRHVPDTLSIAAEDMLANAKWKNVSWRSGTKGRLKARFTAVRVRTADGPPQRIWDKGQQHLPGDEAWLIGEHRLSGEKKYYLANLPAGANLRTLAATIKARWICEQAHQQLKEELGLDHFEGRSWRGLHRHALMTMIAYAFLQHRRLSKARRKKKNQRTAAATDIARRAPGHPRTHGSTTTAAMPALQKIDLQRKAG